MSWRKRPLRWIEDGREHISIVFTWQLPEVRRDILAGNLFAGRPIVGGPAVGLMPEYLADIADIGDSIPGILQRMNELATRTTEGCPNSCGFCAVPRIEGHFRELSDWPDLPIICDNNLLAASNWHFLKVIGRLSRHKGVDFNQGLDARLLTSDKAQQLSRVDGIFRLAWDHVNLEKYVAGAIQNLLSAGIPKTRIRCYVLIGFNDTPTDALYRIETLYRKYRVLPNVQRYTPIDSTEKYYVGDGWTAKDLAGMKRWGNNEYLLRTIPYDEYDPNAKPGSRSQMTLIDCPS